MEEWPHFEVAPLLLTTIVAPVAVVFLVEPVFPEVDSRFLGCALRPFLVPPPLGVVDGILPQGLVAVFLSKGIKQSVLRVLVVL